MRGMISAVGRGRRRARRGPWTRFACLARLFLACTLTFAGTAAASTRDTVVLKNGDRLQGEIKLLEYAKLTFSTDSMGTIYVEWPYVVEVISPAYYEVETSDGGRYYGSFESATRGQIAIQLGGSIQELPVASVVRIRPIKQRFWDRLDGFVNLGASYTSSSGIGQGSVGASVTSRRPTFTVTTTFDATLTTQPDQEDQTRLVFGLGYTRLLAHRWFTGATGKFENNSELGIKLRSSLGGGVGRYVVQTNRTVVAWSGGLMVNREIPIDGDRQDNVESYVGANYSFFTYDRPKTNVTISFVAIPSLSSWGRFRTDFNTLVSREIAKDFTVGTTVYYSYDSRPPTEDARKHDVGVTLSVGWTF
jgi:hypothetical protein